MSRCPSGAALRTDGFQRAVSIGRYGLLPGVWTSRTSPGCSASIHAAVAVNVARWVALRGTYVGDVRTDRHESEQRRA